MSRASFSNLAQNYQTCLHRWDKFAVIRSRPRRILSEYKTDNDIFYPPDRQPMIIHPVVIEKGNHVIKKILLHSAYKFMLDIAAVEVNNIVKASLKIYNKEFNYDFPKSLTDDMLTIIIDEAHHAYIALDYISQIEAVTGIQPVTYQQDVELSFFMKKYLARLTGDMANAFELIAICIGENTLTKELFQMQQDTSVHPFFNDVMSDHMFDEGRHSKIFRQALAHAWRVLDSSIRNSIIDILPGFICDYVSNELNIISSQKILEAVGFDQKAVNIIIKDTYPPINRDQLIRRNPVAANIMSVLERAGLLDSDYATETFVRAGLLM